MPLGHPHVFFREMSLLVFCPFFLIGLFVFFILSSMCCLQILETNPLSVSSFVNISYHCVGCLFILFLGFLCCALFLFLSHAYFMDTITQSKQIVL